MPTYEYECLTEGHRFEEFQNITEAPLTSCPECGSEVRRLISGGAGFLFRGSGFYQTDYRSESSATSSDSGTTGDSSGKKNDSAGKNGRSSGSET